jgi:predicted component of type VI protein secretion system
MFLKVFLFAVFALIAVIGYTTFNVPEKNNSVEQPEQIDLSTQTNQTSNPSERHSKLIQKALLSKKNKLEKTSEFTLAFEAGSLSASIDNISLEAVLIELGKQANINIVVDRSIAEEFVTAEFNSLPLEQGIKRILPKQNYTLTYDDIKVSGLESSPSEMRISELRLISSSKLDFDAQDNNSGSSLAETSSSQKRGESSSLETDGDTFSLNGTSNLQDNIDQDAKTSDDRRATNANALGSSTQSTESTESPSDVVKLEIKSREQTTPAATQEDKAFSDLQAKAYRALQSLDPHAIHEVVQEVSNHPDPERAMDALDAANKSLTE